MVEFKLIYGDRTNLSRAVLARISHSNKLPLQRIGMILNRVALWTHEGIHSGTKT